MQAPGALKIMANSTKDLSIPTMIPENCIKHVVPAKNIRGTSHQSLLNAHPQAPRFSFHVIVGHLMKQVHALRPSFTSRLGVQHSDGIITTGRSVSAFQKYGRLVRCRFCRHVLGVGQGTLPLAGRCSTVILPWNYAMV